MASPTELEKDRPVLLPADFDQWDSGDVPATLPEDFNEFDAVPETGNITEEDEPGSVQPAKDIATAEDAANESPSPEDKNEAETKQGKSARQKGDSRREQTRGEKSNWTKVELRRTPEPVVDKIELKAEVVEETEPVSEKSGKSKTASILMGAVLLLLMIVLVTWLVAFRKAAMPSTSSSGSGAERISQLQVGSVPAQRK